MNTVLTSLENDLYEEALNIGEDSILLSVQDMELDEDFVVQMSVTNGSSNCSSGVCGSSSCNG